MGASPFPEENGREDQGGLCGPGTEGGRASSGYKENKLKTNNERKIQNQLKAFCHSQNNNTKVDSNRNIQSNRPKRNTFP